MQVSKKLIENVGELKKALNEISVYDFDVYTSMELYYKIAKKLNEVIKELINFEGLVSDEVIKQNEKLIYLLGEGLTNEVIKNINTMVENGTLDSIINHNIFNNLNDKIDTLENKVKNRIYNPNFIVSAYWSEVLDNYGNYNIYDESKIDNDIDNWLYHGVDGVTIILHIGHNESSNSLFLGSNLNKIVQYAEKCVSNGLNIHAVKVHKQKITLDHINNNINFNAQYLNILNTIAEKFKTLTNRFIVFNEFNYIYGNETNKNFVLTVINNIKNKGFKVGISTQGHEEMFILDSDIKDRLDILGINHYRYISSKGDKTTYIDSLRSWENATVLKVLEHLKEKNPTKEIVITESGVQDYWCALSKPEYFSWIDTTKTNGKAQATYLYGLMNSTNTKYIDSVWWWYNFSTKKSDTSKITRYLLKGEKYE